MTLTSATPSAIPFDNSYARLPEQFYSRQAPTPVSAPGLIRSNSALAQLLNIPTEWLATEQALQVFAGNLVPEGAEPIATVYAGHQFGGWNPRMGDGRAVLLGEVIGKDGKRYDIQLKGGGQTPYSRNGDGRSPLGPVLREYIVSEAMAVFGVPTTRSLAAVSSGDRVVRDRLLPGGVLTRVAGSHIRIGTFEYFSARQDLESLRLLADHVIGRHYPAAAQAENPHLALLEAVIAGQAQLIAQWQQFGFIHGVMNTDNMLLSGETIDYGPCAFMDNFNPHTVYSSIDTQGRYAYRNQPAIAKWNVSWLANALVPLLADDENVALDLARAAITSFDQQFQATYENGMLKKLGLVTATPEKIALLEALLMLMAAADADFTLTFRRLAELSNPAAIKQPSIADFFELPESFAPWLAQWQSQLAAENIEPALTQQSMFAVNPVFIPRNHLVEEAITAAINSSDYQPFNQLVDVLADPFYYRAEFSRYALPPLPHQVVEKTFCGT